MEVSLRAWPAVETDARCCRGEPPRVANDVHALYTSALSFLEAVWYLVSASGHSGSTRSGGIVPQFGESKKNIAAHLDKS